MSGNRFIEDPITRALQARASDPAASAWVSANAGSGKTFVLARRVIRILLTGTPASRILCLTFTKAAAATMSNRVFQVLGSWTAMDDAKLAAEIVDLEGPPKGGRLAPERLERARRLFAEAIETPGGLKIQTIHAFCESILQQFPLEADLGGNFEVLDDRLGRELIAAARDRVLIDASAREAEPELAAALATAFAAVGEFGLDGALRAVIAARGKIRRWLREAETLDGAIAEVGLALGVRPDDDDAALVAEMLVSPNFPAGALSALVADMGAGRKTDLEQAERIGRARDTARPPEERLAAWWEVFFTKAGPAKAAKSLATKTVVEAHPDFPERASLEVARLAALDDRRAALRTRDTTAALLRLGDRMIGRYEAAKKARGALDFDDLVGRTVDLLSRSDAAAWVQYKLDKGIDHVLVDEAQDTSPEQWEIVRGLTDEFFAGETARRANRTLFAVGDEKQSIYSFQGAAPDAFSASRREFAQAAARAEKRFDDVKLYRSFRSTTAVLSAVDRVFAAPELRARLLDDPDDYTAHTAARETAPGLVEIWPMIRATKTEEPDDWSAPLDRVDAEVPWMKLARAIGREIGELLSVRSRLPGTGLRPRPKDVIVLVRKRGPFVEAMNRVLKEHGIPVAGQDRLRLSDHIAVADLLSLARALVLPEDDLSLAEALKSPLFEANDDDLVRIAAERGERESLDAALARVGAEDERIAGFAGRLARWRDLAGRLPPYELFSRILAADGARRRFVARLGSEADDVLDEFLALALTADRGSAPSLARFVEGLTTDAPEIKRELDETRDEVRVMTVHGAKGLEAPIVFLVDPGAAPASSRHDPKLVLLDVPGKPPGAAPALAWSRGSADPQAVAARRQAHRAAAADEYLRLLYVAMTRAADRLYVCGHAGQRGADANCWHALVEAALRPDCEVETTADGTEILRWRQGPHVPLEAEEKPAEKVASHEGLPAWIGRAAPEAVPLRRVVPSEAEERATPAPVGPTRAIGTGETAGDLDLLRGTLTHRLLEVLPELPGARRRVVAERFVAARGARLSAETRAAIVAEVGAILGDPAFAVVFAPGSRAEVPIVGRIETTRGEAIEVSGRIDRLAVTADTVWIVDHKTDRAGPRAAASEAHVAQTALYRALVARLYPGRTIRCALLWTALPRLEEIPEARLEAALRRIAAS